MDFKIVAKEESSRKQEVYAETDTRVGLFKAGQVEINQNRDEEHSIQYSTPKLIRKDGVYYIGYENDLIAIEEWEAAEVYEHPETVYDVIVSHRRKYYFNTAEDSIANLTSGGYTIIGAESEKKHGRTF